jgi:hypothetical protein
MLPSTNFQYAILAIIIQGTWFRDLFAAFTHFASKSQHVFAFLCCVIALIGD